MVVNVDPILWFHVRLSDHRWGETNVSLRGHTEGEILIVKEVLVEKRRSLHHNDLAWRDAREEMVVDAGEKVSDSVQRSSGPIFFIVLPSFESMCRMMMSL